jgi:hypothetical protein
LSNCVNINNGATMFKAMRKSEASWTMLLIMCALLARMMIPAGWMPTVDSAGFTRITLCTGIGQQEAWLDAKGHLQKSDPGKKHQNDSPCVFSGLSSALYVPQLLPAALILATALVDAPQSPAIISIGRGLAAPPPPATGPPAQI